MWIDVAARTVILFTVVAVGCGKRTQDAPAAPAQPPGTPEPSAPVDPATAPGTVGKPPANSTVGELGVAHIVVRPGAGDARVERFDRVSVHYSTWLTGGSLYFSTATRRAPTSFDLPQVSPGLRAGMLGMRKGEVRHLWIGADVARANERSPKGPVLTRVEVLAIAKGEPPLPAPPDVAAAPADALELPGGVRYLVLAPPTGEYSPERHDRITVRMTSWDTSGKMFESSARHGGSDAMVAGQAPPGVTYALAQMKAGEKRRVWVPLEVVRQRPSQHKKPLVYEVELLEVVDMPDPPDPPKQLTPPKRGVQRTESGIVYKVLKKGRGTRKAPLPKTKVALRMSGWTSDGTLIASTVMNDRPYKARVRTMIGGFKEIVPQMVIGEKRRLWIPAKLAFEGMPAKPQGDVIYDIEVVAIH